MEPLSLTILLKEGGKDVAVAVHVQSFKCYFGLSFFNSLSPLLSI